MPYATRQGTIEYVDDASALFKEILEGPYADFGRIDEALALLRDPAWVKEHGNEAVERLFAYCDLTDDNVSGMTLTALSFIGILAERPLGEAAVEHIATSLGRPLNRFYMGHMLFGTRGGNESRISQKRLRRFLVAQPKLMDFLFRDHRAIFDAQLPAECYSEHLDDPQVKVLYGRVARRYGVSREDLYAIAGSWSGSVDELGQAVALTAR